MAEIVKAVCLVKGYKHFFSNKSSTMFNTADPIELVLIMNPSDRNNLPINTCYIYEKRFNEHLRRLNEGMSYTAPPIYLNTGDSYDPLIGYLATSRGACVLKTIPEVEWLETSKVFNKTSPLFGLLDADNKLINKELEGLFEATYGKPLSLG